MMDSFKLISKYRAELMGYAILGVFIIHIVKTTDIDSIAINQIARLVYTQGFLFLSGFGLYYSFSKDDRIIPFYIKRLKRLYIPYLLISFPFFLVYTINTGKGVGDLTEYLTTIAFWREGNLFGSWYVAVTLVLYALFPLMYNFVFSQRVGGAFLRALILVIIMLMIIVGVKLIAPDYYELTGTWVKKALMFPVGMICGYLSKSDLYERFRTPLRLVPLIALFCVLSKLFANFFYEYARSLFGLFSFPVLFSFLSNNRYLSWLNSVMKWLGTYSLELYLLHTLSWMVIKGVWGGINTMEMILTVVFAIFLCVPVHRFVNGIVNNTL